MKNKPKIRICHSGTDMQTLIMIEGLNVRKSEQGVKHSIDDDDDEIAYFTVR